MSLILNFFSKFSKELSLRIFINFPVKKSKNWLVIPAPIAPIIPNENKKISNFEERENINLIIETFFCKFCENWK